MDPITVSPLPKLHIAFISYRFGHQYGGAEAYGVELMRELAKRHTITVIGHTYDDSCGLKLPFIPIEISSRWPSWLRSYLFAKHVDTLIKQGDYDLVHSHMNGWNGDLDILHVQSVRYKWITRAKSWSKRLLNALSPRIHMYLWLEKQRVHLKPPRRTAVVSEALKQQLQQAYHTQYPFDVITPGVHLPTPCAQTRTTTRAALGYESTDTVCLLVARNPMSKGLNTILGALPHLPENVKLLVIGAATPFKQHPLEQRIQFIGQQTDISAYYQAADIALHPTFNDSFGMAPLEAMAYGLPVIMSDKAWCGFAHYATHKHDAYLLNDPYSSEELQQALTLLLSDKALKKQLGSAGRALAANFSWERIAQQVESIYVEVLATRIYGKKTNNN